MKGNFPEAEKLIDCLRAVINQQKIPQNDILLNWELFYKTADYHHVSNMVYYAVLGMQPAIPPEWMSRFSGRYRKAVITEDQYRKIVEAVLWGCEQSGVHVMALDNWIYRDFYTMPEMRMMDCVQFLVEGKKRPEIERIMYRMDFVPEENTLPGMLCYTRSGLKLIFYDKLQYGNRRLTQYFRRALKIWPKEEGKFFIHRPDEPALFVFLMCNKAQRFADGEFDLRDMVDIWQYYRAVVRGSSWKYIINRLNRLRVWNFANRMLILTDAWFGGGGVGEEQSFYEELEKYIFYKGTQGQETAMRILPLLKQNVRRNKKRLKREKRKKIRSWMFPKRDYVLLLYPKMGKYRLLLPLCWIRRLMRSFFLYIKSKLRNKRNS